MLKKEILMQTLRVLTAALIVAAIVGTGTASQTLAQSEPSTVDKVKNISKREWNRMKVGWSKEKEKWSRCNKEAKDQRLKGRKSWSYVASCMTSKWES
jgi:Asp-tRNA(Asn)/Glu-tRNA(Gln) amidotransferase A subunit family amidase